MEQLALWLPIVLSTLAFGLSAARFVKDDRKDRIRDLEKRLAGVEEQVAECERDRQRLTRENVELMARLVRLEQH